MAERSPLYRFPQHLTTLPSSTPLRPRFINTNKYINIKDYNIKGNKYVSDVSVCIWGCPSRCLTATFLAILLLCGILMRQNCTPPLFGIVLGWNEKLWDRSPTATKLLINCHISGNLDVKFFQRLFIFVIQKCRWHNIFLRREVSRTNQV